MHQALGDLCCVHLGAKKWNRSWANLESRMEFTKTYPPKLVAAIFGTLSEQFEIIWTTEFDGRARRTISTYY